MTVKCRAANQTTCRVHGNGTAIKAVMKALAGKHLTGNDYLQLRGMNERAAESNPDTKQVPLGISVEYVDGSSEIFLGSATDPYHATDYKFYSISSGSSIEGITYGADDSADFDPIETGPHSVEVYKKEFSSATNEHLRLLSDDGEGMEISPLSVQKVTVL